MSQQRCNHFQIGWEQQKKVGPFFVNRPPYLPMSDLETRVKKSDILQILLTFLVFLAIACELSEDPQYISVEKHSFSFSDANSWERYVESFRSHAMGHRFFSQKMPQHQELALISPFWLKRDKKCSAKKGVLLIHGITDTPFAVKDIAQELNKNCFDAIAPILPGHGIRPGNLKNVHRDEWRAAVRFALDKLEDTSDEIYVLGYSLGSLLAMDAAFEDKRIRGVVLLSPAVHIVDETLVWVTYALRYLFPWHIIYPKLIPIKYPTIAVNGMAELSLLLEENHDRIEEGPFETPVLLIQGMQELGIDAKRNVEFFHKHLNYGKNKLIAYGSVPEQMQSKRIEVRPEYFPDKKVLNISHLSLPYHPDNHIFGKNTAFRLCGQSFDFIPMDETKKCLENKENWKGEYRENRSKDYYPLQRLTYNPDFERMLADIRKFLSD